MMKKLRLAFTVLALAFGLCACNTDNGSVVSFNVIKPSVSKKDMPVYICDTEYMSTMPVYFIGDSDVPYISLEDWAELYPELVIYDEGSDEGITYSLDYSINGDVAVLTRKDGEAYTMTVDCKKDTITFDDYDAFMRISEDRILLDILTSDDHKSDDDHVFFKRVPGSYERYGNELVINAKDYGIDFVSDGKTCYVPLQTLCDFLLSCRYMNPIYNKEEVCFIQYGTLFDEETGEPTEIGKMAYSVKPEKVSESMAKFSYAELCLAFDNLYGLKEAHGIERFDDLTDQCGLKEMFLSTDTNDVDEALYNIIELHLDDSHSGMIFPSPFSGEVTVDSLREDVGTGRSNDALQMQIEKFYKAREKFYRNGTPCYEEVGNTAYITFDNFETIPPETDYYETAPDSKATDTIGIMIYAYSQIMRKDSPVENVVLDLSNNTGGDADTAIFVLSSFLGDGYGSLKNTMTGALSTGVYNVDINLDGKFDEKDRGLTDKKRFCLISPVSFSCGNMVPNVFKNSHDVTLIGQTSGGGSCIVLPLTTASASYFQISGPSRLAFTKNGSFYDIDQGADPDYIITFPEDYYDRKALTEYINGLK